MLHIHYRLSVKYIFTLISSIYGYDSMTVFPILLATVVSRRYQIPRYEFILNFMARTAMTVIINDPREMLMKFSWR